jgi:hypothetical protein
MPNPKPARGVIMSTAAINPASAVAGKACDHSIRLVTADP